MAYDEGMKAREGQHGLFQPVSEVPTVSDLDAAEANLESRPGAGIEPPALQLEGHLDLLHAVPRLVGFSHRLPRRTRPRRPSGWPLDPGG